MPTTCVNTGSADVMTADVMIPTTGQGTMHFAVVPVDALGNAGLAASTGMLALMLRMSTKRRWRNH